LHCWCPICPTVGASSRTSTDAELTPSLLSRLPRPRLLRSPPRSPSGRSQLIHGAARPDKGTLSLTVPIHASTAFQIIPDDARAPGDPVFIYSRMGNPTVHAFETRMAVLEGGAGAIAAATGQAATMLVAFCLGRAGDNFVVSAKLFGGSYQQWSVAFARMGIQARFMTTQDPKQWEAAIDHNSRSCQENCDELDVA